ncbi:MULTISPECIES: Crp/Fnr family transcriptional regulator [Sulfurimonas]|uniref:Crp/Fnr family transcriptional regulator n=1 Tax=Sulfurimonas TaxID=202746 RepID=UPI0012653FF4|nr:Crp/Fnr family transcriptional regulator [Sulfurimonas indica]
MKSNSCNLENFSFYEKLDTDILNFLDACLKPVNLKKGATLFFQGDICDSILFLTQGEVRLYISSESADEITLYHLKPAEQCIVNTASALSQTEAIASAVAVTDIQGYILPTKHVKKLAQLSSAYQDYLFSIYTLRMESLARLVNDIKFKTLDERIMDWLNSKHTKEIQTTHETIANELGSSREVISKVLKSLEKSGIIKLSRGSIMLL